MMAIKKPPPVLIVDVPDISDPSVCIWQGYASRGESGYCKPHAGGLCRITLALAGEAGECV